MNRVGYVFGCDVLRVSQVGNRAAEPGDRMVGAGGADAAGI